MLRFVSEIDSITFEYIFNQYGVFVDVEQQDSKKEKKKWVFNTISVPTGYSSKTNYVRHQKMVRMGDVPYGTVDQGSLREGHYDRKPLVLQVWGLGRRLPTFSCYWDNVS